MSNKHVGTGIDEFLRDKGVFQATEARAIKEVLAWQLARSSGAKSQTEGQIHVRVDEIRKFTGSKSLSHPRTYRPSAKR